MALKPLFYVIVANILSTTVNIPLCRLITFCTRLKVAHIQRPLCAHMPHVGPYLDVCVSWMCICARTHVRRCLPAVSAHDGHSHTWDMTTDWQTDHQHSSRPPPRTLSGCQREFMQRAGVRMIWPTLLLCWLTNKRVPKMRMSCFITVSLTYSPPWLFFMCDNAH